MQQTIRDYLSEIGRRGGRKSKRTLDPVMAQTMVKVREARRAYKKFYAQCFWSYDPDLKISASDIDWVAQQLRKNGNWQAWEVAERLCR